MNRILSFCLLALITLLTACGGGGGGGGGGGAGTKGKLEITIFESDGTTVIATAQIQIQNETHEHVATGTTDAAGKASFTLAPGVYSATIHAQGFEMSPPRGVAPIPFTIVAKETFTTTFQLDDSANPAADSIIRGNADFPGLLIVAEDSTQQIAVSGISGVNGDYVLFNVLPGDYTVRALASGYLTNTPPAQTITGGQDVTVNLDVVKQSQASLTGQITFLATANGVVDITLIHPITLDAIPGLATESDTGLNYALADLPAGEYLAWASFANDGYVMDPDWINKNGGYPDALEVVMTAANQVKNFSVTGAITLTSPTNAADEVVPAEVTTLTPTFSWVAYPSTKHYVVEVLDLEGNTLWGGYTFNPITEDSTFHHPDIGTNKTAVYDFDGSASQALVDGETYQWRVYAFNDASPKIALSSSEQQMGLFKVVLPPP